MRSNLRPRVAAVSLLLASAICTGRPVPSRVLAAASLSTELQAELVAHLHAYTGQHKTLVVPDPAASTKSVEVTGITDPTADDTYLYVRSIAVQLRESVAGGQHDVLYGSARGQFRLERATPAEACVAAAPGSASALTVTSLDIPHVSGRIEYDAAKQAIAASFPEKLCVPLYPSVVIDDVGEEECLKSSASGAPQSTTARFTVALSNLSARMVAVRYATADASARAGMDYTAVGGTLKIPSLSASGTISVPLRCRPGNQGARAFTVNLTDPGNSIVTRRQAQGLIIDSHFRR